MIARPGARLDAGRPSGAGTCGSRTASTCGCRKPASTQALERLVALDRDKKLLSRDITSVDLRLPDRVTVRLSDAGGGSARETRSRTRSRRKEAQGMSSLAVRPDARR